jgi:hypothetical protein
MENLFLKKSGNLFNKPLSQSDKPENDYSACISSAKSTCASTSPCASTVSQTQGATEPTGNYYFSLLQKEANMIKLRSAFAQRSNAAAQEKRVGGNLNDDTLQMLKKSASLKGSIKGLVGHPYNSYTLNQYSSKEIVYSFNKVNNLYPLLTKIEYLLKSFFLSMYSLISRPVYLIKHDKVIIQLFVFFSPIADKYLDTSTFVKDGKLRGPNKTIFKSKNSRYATNINIKNYLKFKSFRPNASEILNYQVANSTKQDVLKSNSFFKFFLDLKNSPAATDARAAALSALHSQRQAVMLGPAVHAQQPHNSCLLALQPLRLPKAESASDYTSLLNNFKNKLDKLSVIFSKILKKKVEFNLIKAHIPSQDSNFITQLLGYNANHYNFRRMLKIIIPRAVIKNPSKNILPPSPYPLLKSLNLLGNDQKALMQNKHQLKAAASQALNP